MVDRILIAIALIRENRVILEQVHQSPKTHFRHSCFNPKMSVVKTKDDLDPGGSDVLLHIVLERPVDISLAFELGVDEYQGFEEIRIFVVVQHFQENQHVDRLLQSVQGLLAVRYPRHLGDLRA